MKINNSIAFVTGANRGLGLAYAKALLAAGARKVYAGARDPSSVPVLEGLVPVRLDVNKIDDIAAAAAQCGDVDLLINNAGIIGDEPLLGENGVEALHNVLDTNLYGVLAMSRAFAPVLRANGGGALVNMLSALSWASLPGTGAYSVSKAAAWALTNGLRNELRGQGTQVVGVHAGYIDTDMVKGVDSPKSRPEDIAQAVLAGIEAGDSEVLADDTARHVKAGFSATPSLYLG
ncbi:SDR family oxidoreductase [Rhodanobacter glycinis]|uniref:SDR family oxidoreductase n=1 Tax=Rhodanobacter glycinis TaxID=582702 RepID=A0A502C3P6_9GAMM|nr:SDR family oxidoreductase [Rhodanobacter glycinis]TPG07254.1 SDR family oxidoreductase [Rhodanobacter glycinis]TPG46096.1 SDR family oxidoreductase [Rhodanobacter glycinis]